MFRRSGIELYAFLGLERKYAFLRQGMYVRGEVKGERRKKKGGKKKKKRQQQQTQLMQCTLVGNDLMNWNPAININCLVRQKGNRGWCLGGGEVAQPKNYRAMEKD